MDRKTTIRSIHNSYFELLEAVSPENLIRDDVRVPVW